MMLQVKGCCYGPRVETQRMQKEALDNMNESKDFDKITQNTQRQDKWEDIESRSR